MQELSLTPPALDPRRKARDPSKTRSVRSNPLRRIAAVLRLAYCSDHQPDQTTARPRQPECRAAARHDSHVEHDSPLRSTASRSCLSQFQRFVRATIPALRAELESFPNG